MKTSAICSKRDISSLTFVSGGENDDHSRDNILRVLAAVPPIFHHDFDVSGYYQLSVHPGNLSGHLLVGHEQFDVQPHHLLLDECQVKHFIPRELAPRFK